MQKNVAVDNNDVSIASGVHWVIMKLSRQQIFDTSLKPTVVMVPTLSSTMALVIATASGATGDEMTIKSAP